MQRSIESQHLDGIVVFTAVAECGSFTAAAERLARHASVLSRHISGLEARLGVKLLHRTTRKISLTEAGSAYLERVRSILASLEEADAEASAAGQVTKGLLRVSAPVNFGRIWVASLIPEFLEQNPAVEIDLRLSNRFVDIVTERFDVAVRLGELKDSGLLRRKVASHRRQLLAAPTYLAQHGIPQHPSELVGHACLLAAHLSDQPQWAFRREGKRLVVPVKGPLTADETEALIPAALAGLGIVTCADWLATDDVAEGRLVPVLDGWTLEGEGAIHLVMPSGRLIPRKTRAFVDWFAGRLSPAPPWAAGE